jgi:aminoglycoside/choline kinase family phosphotransferase
LSRDERIAAFLAGAGFGTATTHPLAQDASFRRYLRLAGGPRPAIVMDASPDELPPFVRVARHLCALGLSVPEIIAADEAAGLLLLEDFGDALFHALPPADVETAFDAATDALRIMRAEKPPSGLPEWGAAEMRAAALATFFDWWWPAAFGTPAPDEARAEFGAALTETLAPLDGEEPVFTHRDYFSGNLILLRDRAGPRRAGIIDFQSAATGPAAYDVASLTQDSRRTVAARIAARCVERSKIDPALVAICAAQRHMRVAGLWTRLAERDGKPQYLAYAPHTWRMLESALTHPANRALASAFDRWIPAEARPAR